MSEQSYSQRDVRTRALDQSEFVEGTLLSIVQSDNGKIYTVQASDGSIDAIYGSSHVDRNIFESDVGRQVFLKYIGKEDIGSGHTYKRWKIGVKDGKQVVNQETPKETSSTNATPF